MKKWLKFKINFKYSYTSNFKPLKCTISQGIYGANYLWINKHTFILFENKNIIFPRINKDKSVVIATEFC